MGSQGPAAAGAASLLRLGTRSTCSSAPRHVSTWTTPRASSLASSTTMTTCSPVHPARGAPLHHAPPLLVRHQVCGWRPHHLLRVPQHGRAHRHVLLLLHVRHGAQRAEVPLVEKILDPAAAHSVCDILHSRLFPSLLRV